MMWLEMSRDITHGGEGWAFTECLWCPSHKNQKGKWRFWESLLEVREGDLVFHMRGGTHKQLFVGYSTADSAGYETKERPPEPGEWGYASSYFRVPLRDFIAFADPIPLDVSFSAHDAELRSYFQENKAHAVSKERLFYVVQSNRLQCLNGAYCSEISPALVNILFGIKLNGETPIRVQESEITARTGQQLQLVAARIGQQAFSDSVKENYNGKCCFPGCSVTEPQFLIGAHIARWADAQELRGKVSNGLCLCLMHDKAFEIGMFTLNLSFEVVLNPKRSFGNSWAETNLRPYTGKTISLGTQLPAQESIRRHWDRIEYQP